MAPSSIAWLDSSPDEQRKVRELLSLFEQKESRDELGVAQIRDVFSNALFPGTSVLQTRARYYLFVPWCFLKAARREEQGDKLNRLAHDHERTLAETLRTTNAGQGVIGAQRGAAIRTLPSTMFWNGLVAHGILLRDTTPQQLQGLRSSHQDMAELAARTMNEWHPTLPSAPADFPNSVPGGFTLTREEADWLRERIVTASEGSLLANILRRGELPSADSGAPWEDPAARSAAGDQAEILNHARRFSLVMRGASRLYSLLVAEAYAAADLGAEGWQAEGHRNRYLQWARSCDENVADMVSWDTKDFWRLVLAVNPGITTRTRIFVDEWIDVLRSGQATQAAEPGTQARLLISGRERSIKRGQSRLDNLKLLSQWGGAGNGLPGATEESVDLMDGLYTYRWPNVRRIVRDILEVTHA